MPVGPRNSTFADFFAICPTAGFLGRKTISQRKTLTKRTRETKRTRHHTHSNMSTTVTVIRKRPHCSATSVHELEAIKLMPPPPPLLVPVMETEWERKRRQSDIRRAENAFMEQRLRRERAEVERIACERTRIAVDNCERSELHAFLEELRVSGRVSADEIVKRLARRVPA